MKAEILKEAYDYKGQYIMENFEISNFVRSFVRDCELMGESAINLYKTFYFIDEEDIRGLYDNLTELQEMAKIDSPFMFEDRDLGGLILEDEVLNGVKIKEVKTPNPASPNRSGPNPDVAGSGRTGFDEYANMFKPKTMKIPLSKADFDKLPETVQKYYQVKFENAAKAVSAEDAAKILQQPPSASDLGGSVGSKAKQLFDKATGKKIYNPPNAGKPEANAEFYASLDKAKNANGGITPKAPVGILAFLSNIWGKIKGFFGSGIKSIGDTVSSGNWGGLIKIPLVQSALVVGGVGIAFGIVKKLLGNRAKGKEAEIKAALEAKRVKA